MQSLTDQLHLQAQGLLYLLPEACLALLALVLLLLSLFRQPAVKVVGRSLALLGITTYAAAKLLPVAQQSIPLFNGQLVLSPFTITVSGLLALATLLALLLPIHEQDDPPYCLERTALVTLQLLGLNIMVMSQHLTLLLLGLELAGISGYLLLSLPVTPKRLESGLKYLLFGTTMTAVYLYGASWVYGGTGHLNLNEVALATLEGQPTIVQIGLIGIVLSLLFKLGAVPVHAWLPELYQASPQRYLAVQTLVPKLAAAAVIKQLLTTLSISSGPVLLFLVAATVASLLLPIASAWQQKKLFPLLGWASIVQAGFLLIPVLSQSGSTAALLFYFVVYTLGVLAVFAFQANQPTNTPLSNWAGLGKSQPMLSLAITLVLASFIGLPPGAGFYAKWFVFASLYSTYDYLGNPVYLLVLIAAIIASALSVSYYLRLPYQFYFQTAEAPSPSPSRYASVYIGVLTVLLMVLFLAPSLAIDWINTHTGE